MNDASDETVRLRALRRSGLLDQSGEEQFARLVTLVRDVLDVPAAIISLIDAEYQVFAGQEGLPEPWASAGRTPLSHSFCRHVVEREEPVVIDDARLDPVLCSNPAITDIGVQAYLGVPLRLPSGEVVGALASIDVKPRAWTEKDRGRMIAIADIVMAEMAVRVSEVRWRTLFQDMQEGFYIGDAVRDPAGRLVDFRFELINPAFEKLTGVSSELALGQTLRECFPEIDDQLLEIYGRVLQTGVSEIFEIQIPVLDNDWFEGRVRRLDDDRFAVVFTKVTERKQAEIKLIETDERRRLVIEIGDIGIWDLDFVGGGLLGDARIRQAHGVSDGTELDLKSALDAIHPEDRVDFDRDFRNILWTDQDSFEVQYRVIGIDDGVTRWLLVKGRILRDAARRPLRIVGAMRDVTDRVNADERRRVLNSELSHRMKNNLAIVQSIVSQTLRTAPDVVTAHQSLSRRIQALSKAHESLLTGHLDGAPVRTVIENACLIHDDGIGRIDLEGPDLQIGDKAALTLSLIVNELATNAGKYGALSTELGHVDVRWSVAPDATAGVPVLTFEWSERGGPPVVAPERTGFGSRLIQLGLSGSAGGVSEIVYAPDGLRCRIVSPLLELRDGGAGA